jgi:phosphoglycolate phosphatase-like HAD superfamily hydrolase
VRKRILITDVDNTLLDWQDLWYETFSAMIDKVVDISGVDRDLLYAQCSVVHQKYGTSEYSRLLGELPCLQALYGDDTLKVLQPAIDAFREARRRVLRLYPTVEDTLKTLKASGVITAAFTESKAFYTNYRFRKLGLDGLIEYLYSPADHSMPDETSASRFYEPENYEFKQTVHHFTPEGEVKPNPDILLSIISDLGGTAEEVVYARSHAGDRCGRYDRARFLIPHYASGVFHPENDAPEEYLEGHFRLAEGRSVIGPLTPARPALLNKQFSRP